MSIVMVTHGKLPFTKLCIESVLENTTEPGYELIVVDNGSPDGTRDYLDILDGRHGHVSAVFTGRNLGFAAASNLGVERARGDILVLLNNDTIVPPGWLEGLVRHLHREGVGAVGPVTNRICNEAQVDADYDTYGEFLELAHAREAARREQGFEVPMLAMFCFSMKRSVFERVGRIDEGFGRGTLEDDDYSHRVRRLGLKLWCAEDVFVHHFGQASFGDMVPSGEYQALLEVNRRRFEEKWGIPWEPYGRRQSDDYRVTKRRIREVVSERIPRSTTVAVVSRGDDELVRLDGRCGWHVPRTPSGEWAGWYPEGSAEAIEVIEALRSQGADYLLVPDPSRWWLDFYAGLRHHLDAHYDTIVQEPGVCTVFSLRTREIP